MPRRRLRVDGIVQGVGFRPFVYNLARDERLTGLVTNTSAGVVIEIEGEWEILDRFARRLRDEAPPLSQIVAVDAEEIEEVGDDDFVIRASENTPGTATLIPPDIAVCSDCLREIRDPGDRRHGYAFTNCTNCGPRWTIIGRIPYDRPYTSMAPFTMCAACQAEYDDPGDRRFHAQPNACPDCGPRLWLVDDDGSETHIDALEVAADQLAAGRILAIKGLGGFHLAVRADNSDAVARLRERKHREAKPLAVMIASSSLEGRDDLLTSPQSPIVLLKRDELPADLGAAIAAEVAPAHRRLGVMLPYTPLHQLLFDALAERGVPALVMTSGNASDEPICLGNDEALERLRGIADTWLLHDREILRRADDSVVQVLDEQPHFFRRSRGYAPVPILLKGIAAQGVPVLAVGPELKNTVCLLKEDRAFLSPHIGDLENLKAFEFFKETATNLQQILECEPDVIAHDLHPGYFSTQWAKEAAAEGKQLIAVQHHHAHLAAVLAEHGADGPAVGLIMDGTGYGTDGTIWGGEILVGDARSFERVGHLEPLRLPGGEAAIRSPWRTAISALRNAFGADPEAWPRLPWLALRDFAPLLEMIEREINSPLTTSCGRLFDAVAALTGNWSDVHYEAQAAIEWMALTDRKAVAAAEPWRFDEAVGSETPFVVPTSPIIREVAEGVVAGVAPETLSARFHATMIDCLTRAARQVAENHGLTTVVLGGGAFQNEILLTGLFHSLTAIGLQPLRPVQTPVNDGAIALGQAVVARAYNK